MFLSHSRISVGAHFAFTSSFSTTAAFPAIRCRCGKPFSAAPFLQAFWTAFSLCLFATTAAFPAIRCRCGKPFSSVPFLQAFWTAFSLCLFAATAAFPAIRCRCGQPFSSAPFLQAFWTAFSLCLFATTAAFSAIRCRCGKHPSCRPSGRHSPSASLPQRQHFPRFGAVVESPIPLRPFYRPSGRHCRHFLFPQRQQIPRFGAVVGCGFGLAAKVRRMSKRASGQRKRTVSKIDQCQNWMAKIVTKTVWRSRWQK